MKTYYRVKATGQWCAPSYENGGADPDAIAETLGLQPGAVEAVEVEDGDPRTGDLLTDPNIPDDAPPAPRPDAPAFKLAAYAYLGASAFVAPLSGYISPTLDSLNEGNWAIARQIIGFAAQAGALTAQQYADINALLAQHNIPEA